MPAGVDTSYFTSTSRGPTIPQMSHRDEGQGFTAAYLTHVVALAQLAVHNYDRVTIPRVNRAIDCGLMVNPNRVRSVSGCHHQGHRDAMPEAGVHIVDIASPGGIGKPGVHPRSAGQVSRRLVSASEGFRLANRY
jgi:hypothetical protein